jgi:hypothetical protein
MSTATHQATKLTVAAAWVENNPGKILAFDEEFGDEMMTSRRRAGAKFTNEIVSNCREVRINGYLISMQT